MNQNQKWLKITALGRKYLTSQINNCYMLSDGQYIISMDILTVKIISINT